MADAGGGAGRRITVSSVSCRGVKSFVPFQKPPLYAAVSHGGRREKTPADPDGGENPDWDGASFAFDLDDDGLLRFEVKAQVPLLGTKLVGTACVPVADLAGVPRRASYQLLAPDGKPNGSLSFAYSVADAAACQQQPQIYAARPEQDLNNSCCAPPPPSSCAGVYPAPAVPNVAPHGSGYPPSAPLYPPLQDFLPPSSYPPPPPPPTMEPLFPAPNFGSHSSYLPPPAQATVYPPPPASCTACPAPPAQYSSNYPPPPPPPSYYPPPPPSGYPPPPRMNPEYPASSFSSYPPPAPQPQPEFCLDCPPLPAPRSVDRALHYMVPPSQGSAITYPELAVPSGGSYYPPPGTQHREEEARPPCYYPPPGTRHREEEARPPYYYPPPGTR